MIRGLACIDKGFGGDFHGNNAVRCLLDCKVETYIQLKINNNHHMDGWIDGWIRTILCSIFWYITVLGWGWGGLWLIAA